jgi:hypothetical protein
MAAPVPEIMGMNEVLSPSLSLKSKGLVVRCQKAEPCLLVNFMRLHDIKSQINTVILGSDRIAARATKHSSAIQRPDEAASRESAGSGQNIHAVWFTRL